MAINSVAEHIETLINISTLTGTSFIPCSGSLISNSNLQTTAITSTGITNSNTITSNIINSTTANLTNASVSNILTLLSNTPISFI